MVTTADIPPGGEGKIDVTLNTRGRRGKLEKVVEVYSNDPAKPKFQLRMSGLVELIADFNPNRLNLGNVLKGTTKIETVKTVAKEIEKLELKELTPSDPTSLKAEIVKQDGAPAVKVTFIAGDKERHFSGRITAKTNLEKPAQLDLFVYGTVTSDLVPDRTFVFFPTFDAKNPPSFPVKVSSLSGKPFNITKVEDVAGAVTGAAEKKDKEVLVTLKMIKDKPPRGKVQLHTDRKDQPVIEIPYSVRTAGPNPAGPGGPMINPRVIEPIRLQGQPGRPGEPVPLNAPPGKPGGPPLQLKPGFKRLPVKLQPGQVPPGMQPGQPPPAPPAPPPAP